MKKIFILNAGKSFLHAQGEFNRAVTAITIDYFKERDERIEIQVTDINAGYQIIEEIEKYKWADLIIYHTPIWWFNIPQWIKTIF